MGRFCNPVLIVFLVGLVAAVELPQNRTRAATSKYYVLDTLHNWQGALEHCHRLGMRLAVVNSAADHNEIVLLVMNSRVFNINLTRVWIGATDLDRVGNYVWTETGLPLKGSYSNWYPGEPNNAGGVEHCAEMRYVPNSGMIWEWNDVRCTHSRFSVCEKAPRCSPKVGTRLVKPIHLPNEVISPVFVKKCLQLAPPSSPVKTTTL